MMLMPFELEMIGSRRAEVRRLRNSGEGRRLHADRNRNAIGDDVEHGRSGLRLHHDLLELLGAGIAIDLEGDLDALVAVAHLFGEAEEPRRSMSPSILLPPC